MMLYYTAWDKNDAGAGYQQRLTEMAAAIRELKREGRFVVRKISELADAMRESMPGCAADIDRVLAGLATLVAEDGEP